METMGEMLDILRNSQECRRFSVLFSLLSLSLFLGFVILLFLGSSAFLLDLWKGFGAGFSLSVIISILLLLWSNALRSDIMLKFTLLAEEEKEAVRQKLLESI